MKTSAFLLLVIGLTFAHRAFAQSVTGQIKEVDPAAKSFIVTGAKGEFHTFRTKFTTEILINGERSALTDLAPGASVQVSPGEKGYAGRIVSPAPGVRAKPAPAQSVVKIPATAGRAKPVTVGAVSAGQRVTVTPNKVWWSGGGSRKGAYCDWRGYERSNISGLPWMALVAAVGTDEYWPKDNTLSFTVPAAGVLTLFANDTGAQDNDGQGHVTVSVASP